MYSTFSISIINYCVHKMKVAVQSSVNQCSKNDADDCCFFLDKMNDYRVAFEQKKNENERDVIKCLFRLVGKCMEVMWLIAVP